MQWIFSYVKCVCVDVFLLKTTVFLINFFLKDFSKTLNKIQLQEI